MENYSHPDIPDIIQQEGNSECVDCGSPKPKWASMNNGIFLCLKCAGVHRSFGMSISLIRSLQIDSWTEKQLLYLTKGGNNNFKKNLQEFNIDPASASVDIKYKSKAADYYRRFLKNEVDRESDSNYVPTQIIKPELNVAQEILEIKEENKEDNQNNEKKEDKKPTNKFFGFMSSVFTKVKDSTTGAAKSVEKGFTDLKLGEKFKVAGSAIAGAVHTSGNFIVDTTQKAVNSEFVQNVSKKTKEGVNAVVQKTKTIIQKKDANNENGKNEESSKEINVKKEEEKKEEEKKEEEKKEEEKKEEEKKEEEKKEEKKEEEKKEEKKEENKEEKKEEEKKEDSTQNNVPGSNPVPEEKVAPAPEGENQNAQS